MSNPMTVRPGDYVCGESTFTRADQSRGDMECGVAQDTSQPGVHQIKCRDNYSIDTGNGYTCVSPKAAFNISGMIRLFTPVTGNK